MKNILFEVGTSGAHVMDCSLTSFLSLMMIGPGAPPESITGAGAGHWVKLTSRLGAGPAGTTISVHYPAADGNWTKSGPHTDPVDMT